MVIREILEERRRKFYLKKRLKKMIVSAIAFCLALQFVLLPATEALFRNAMSGTVVFTVTENDYPIKGSLVVNKTPGLTMTKSTGEFDLLSFDSNASYRSDDDIFVTVLLEDAYEAANVDISTVKVCKDDISIPIMRIWTEGNALILSFNEETAESLLGFGNHTIQADGMFDDGWIHFYAQGELVLIDEELVAEQKAAALVEKLEAETSLDQEKIDTVRESVLNIRAGQVKDELLLRVQAVQDKLNRIFEEIEKQKLLEEARNALLLAEETRSSADFEIAKSLIDKLPDGDEKGELQDRLKAIMSEEEVPHQGEEVSGGTEDPVTTAGTDEIPDNNGYESTNYNITDETDHFADEIKETEDGGA